MDHLVSQRSSGGTEEKNSTAASIDVNPNIFYEKRHCHIEIDTLLLTMALTRRQEREEIVSHAFLNTYRNTKYCTKNIVNENKIGSLNILSVVTSWCTVCRIKLSRTWGRVNWQIGSSRGRKLFQKSIAIYQSTWQRIPEDSESSTEPLWHSQST